MLHVIGGDDRMNTQFPNLVMLYASHVLQGLRQLENTPAALLEDVTWVVENAKKKTEEA